MRCGGPPSNSRARRRQTSGPLQGPPASRPRQGAAHFALLRINVSGYSSSAPPAGGKAASDFRLEARIRGRKYALAQSTTTSTVSATPPPISRWEPQCCAGKSAALGASLGVGPAPPVVCQAESATPPSSPFLQGTASPWFNLAATPPGLVRLRLRTLYAALVHVRYAPVSGGYSRLLASYTQSLLGSQEAAVRIRSRLLAQTVSVIPPLVLGLRLHPRLKTPRHCKCHDCRRAAPTSPPGLHSP